MSKTWYGHYIENIKGEDYVLFKDYLELDKEIERLKNKVKEISEEMNYQINLKTKNANEINRLTNIINELEKYLNEQVDYMTHLSIERMVAFDCCRHKLQELKGSDKK